ncbi:hypothetical protein CRE_06269 [Caenorhabditis remanei]|uniref:Uncharacterized protein n=1 Tax=Caenorhabditis remanei TaxID=31234 RepID=E3NVQ5_CAERE|nr:hypothetical protein CRE_06269 [Caenorhabditis remanei]
MLQNKTTISEFATSSDYHSKHVDPWYVGFMILNKVGLLLSASDASVQSDDLHNVVSDVSAASYSSNSSNQNWTTENDGSAINSIYNKEFVHGDMITRIKRDGIISFSFSLSLI